ncbi:MAG TPA: cytochrome c oxidase subunit II [Gemmatimonadales bacterium]|nr:cytochrome c oxidase subunit II [Gemmatimonadales bacterium]
MVAGKVGGMSDRVRWWAAGGAAVWGLLAAGCSRAPSYLHTRGYAADQQAKLGWSLLIIASVVVLVIAALVLWAVLRHPRGEPAPVARSTGGLRWVVVGGIIVPAVVLLVTFIFTMATYSALAAPPAPPALTIQVVGHRWWWEAKYPGRSPGDLAVTANEIHIPVSRPVRFELTTADVIHSFWFPELGGKTDLIPGQRNVTWLQADTAGTYWGQCTEYCGLQHAHMQMSIVAEPAAEFRQWLDRQREPASPPTEAAARQGQQIFTASACSLCHTVRGTDAHGAVGPDLTHVATRASLAAGALPNTRGYLAGWIANPQELKPGTAMPAVGLSPQQLQAVVTYLESLR